VDVVEDVADLNRPFGDRPFLDESGGALLELVGKIAAGDVLHHKVVFPVVDEIIVNRRY
jgi:hypothetical protein